VDECQGELPITRFAQHREEGEELCCWEQEETEEVNAAKDVFPSCCLLDWEADLLSSSTFPYGAVKLRDMTPESVYLASASHTSLYSESFAAGGISTLSGTILSALKSALL